MKLEIVCSKGLRMESMKLDMCCVKVPIPETIGRPSEWILRDCIILNILSVFAVLD